MYVPQPNVTKNCFIGAVFHCIGHVTTDLNHPLFDVFILHEA